MLFVVYFFVTLGRKIFFYVLLQKAHGFMEYIHDSDKFWVIFFKGMKHGLKFIILDMNVKSSNAGDVRHKSNHLNH